MTNGALPTPPPPPGPPEGWPPTMPAGAPPSPHAPPHAVAPPWAYPVPAPDSLGGAYSMPYWPPALVPRLPRVWSALVVPIIAIIVATFVSGIALAAAAISDIGVEGMGNHERFMDWVESRGATPGGFLLLVLPAQLSMMACALGAALLSPVPLRKRLGLNRPSCPWWLLLLLLPATWFSGMCGDLLMSSLFQDPSENLESLYRMFEGASGAFLVLVTLCIGLLPGFGEEMLFRGYAQRRLLQRWHPAAAIGVSSVLFAAAHLDPAHVVAVVPMGIWFGVVAWLTGSIWPAILCHTANNAAAVLITKAAPELATEPAELTAGTAAMLAGTGMFVLLSLWVMLRHRAPAEPEAAPPVVGYQSETLHAYGPAR